MGVGLDIILPEANRRAEGCGSFLETFPGQEGMAELEVADGPAGLEARGFAQSRQRPLQVLLLLQSDAELQVSVGIIRLEMNRLPKGGFRLCQVPRQQRLAEVQVDAGELRALHQGGPEEADRLVG